MRALFLVLEILICVLEASSNFTLKCSYYRVFTVRNFKIVNKDVGFYELHWYFHQFNQRNPNILTGESEFTFFKSSSLTTEDASVKSSS